MRCSAASMAHASRHSRHSLAWGKRHRRPQDCRAPTTPVVRSRARQPSSASRRLLPHRCGAVRAVGRVPLRHCNGPLQRAGSGVRCSAAKRDSRAPAAASSFPAPPGSRSLRRCHLQVQGLGLQGGYKRVVGACASGELPTSLGRSFLKAPARISRAAHIAWSTVRFWELLCAGTLATRSAQKNLLEAARGACGADAALHALSAARHHHEQLPEGSIALCAFQRLRHCWALATRADLWRAMPYRVPQLQQ